MCLLYLFFLQLLVPPFFLQLLGRPYKTMKESLSLQEPLHNRILEGYQQKLIKYLPYLRRRGTAPAKDVFDMQKIIQSSVLISKNDSQRNCSLSKYPFSTLGLVKLSAKTEQIVSVGAIIHQNLIITAVPAIFTSPSQFQFQPFFQLEKCMSLNTKKIHPSNLEIKRSSHQLSIEQEKEGEGATHCIILELDKKNKLEEQYGSLGISFAEENHLDLVLLGVVEGDSSYKVFEEQIQVLPSSMPNHLLYRLRSNRRFIRGSLIVHKSDKQFMIKGIHLQNDEIQGKGLKLTKQRWGQFNKMTYKGAEVDLSHEHINRKGIQFISQLNLKKVCELYLQRSSINNPEFQIICGLNYSLIELNIGYNSIDNDGIVHLVNANWYLHSISLTKNQLNFQGIKFLTKNRWRNLRNLILDQNQIGTKGIKYLVQCDWKDLKNLSLSIDLVHKGKACIDDTGCNHLRKGKWYHLTDVDLNHNKIGLRGAMNLVNAEWKQLVNINLIANCLGFEGIKQLVKAEWKSMKAIGIIEGNNPGKMYRNPSDRGKAMSFMKQILKNKFHHVHVL